MLDFRPRANRKVTGHCQPSTSRSLRILTSFPPLSPGFFGGEGAKLRETLINGALDLVAHAAWITQHLVPRDSQHHVATLRQPPIALLVAPPTCGGVMVFAVHFHDQLKCHATEVGRIERNRMLAAELLVAALSIPHHVPDGAGELIRPSALLARERDCILRMLTASFWVWAFVHADVPWGMILEPGRCIVLPSAGSGNCAGLARGCCVVRGAPRFTVSRRSAPHPPSPLPEQEIRGEGGQKGFECRVILS